MKQERQKINVLYLMILQVSESKKQGSIESHVSHCGFQKYMVRCFASPECTCRTGKGENNKRAQFAA